MAGTNAVEHALHAQAASCATVGSPLYAALLEGLLADHRGSGLTAELLDGVSERPVHDAVPLRFLATGHLLALTGRAPRLARHYPSCGGSWHGAGGMDDVLTVDFLDIAAAHRDEFVAGLQRNVQTNEVGRAPVLASGLAWIAARHRLPIDQLEIGSSAGLLSRWDHYAYDTGRANGTLGDPASAVRFGPQWWTTAAPDLSVRPTVVRRRACDISPIDISSESGRATMLSFVWPDQIDRIDRMRAAFSVAATVALHVDAGDAGEWLTTQLAGGPATGAVTVVFHSIVWQYLPTGTRDAVRQALATAGAVATASNPLCWLRMEPVTREHADLRLTTWPGGDEIHLADVGYHGADIRWFAPPPR